MFSKKETFEKTAGAILYPDRIIIETRNVENQYSCYSTDHLTSLNLEISDSDLGHIVSKHLDDSKMEKNYSRDLRKSYLHKLKVRSETAARKDANYVAIFSTSSTIRFEPRNNKVSDGRSGAYYGMPKEIFEISINVDMETLGKATRNAWSKCIFS